MGQNLGPLNIKDTYQSLVQISGSVLTDGSGSAIPSVTVNASTATSASFATTATTSTSASYASTATSASYATTASFALNVTPIDTGSFVTTASISDADITFTKADASTFNIEVNNVSSSISASHADNASTADSATTATSASFATTASFAGNAGSSFLATSASHALVADTATSASYATNASTADSATSASHAVNADSATTATTATSASYATTASHALGLVDGLNINATSITASGANFTNLTATSASIGFLQTVTGSATIIGDAFILLNTSDATRYAGLLVEDSGSATPVNYTASFFFDSLLNDWNYEYTTTASTDYGVALFGPTYNTKGSPTYLTANTIAKAEGTHHLVDSNISDDGSNVTIASNATVSTAGATADLVVTSDDDFTYQSQLRIGGGAGGAGNGFYLANFNDTSSVTTDNGLLSISLGGTLQLQGLNYPSTDGNAGEFLATDGAGNLSFVTASTATSASYATTASFAVSASWAPTPAPANLQEVTTIGASTSASIVMSDGIVAYNTIQGNGSGFFIQSSDDSTDMLLAFADSIGISTGEVRFAPTTGLLSMYADNGIEVQSATTFTQGTTHTGATTFSSSVAGVVNPLTISSQTASMDCSTANFFTLELPNAATHLVASNIQAGQTTNLRVTHTSTSSGSLAFSDSFLFAGGTAFEVTPATSSVDVMTFISFNGSTLEATGLKNFS